MLNDRRIRIRISDQRIRIRNTALEGFYLKSIKCVPAPPELRDLNAKLMEDCVHEVVDNAKLRGEFRYKERFRIRPDVSLIILPDPDPDP